MTTDFRALCAELVDAWDTARTPSHFIDTADQPSGVIDKIRTALAEPEPEGATPQPIPVSERLPGCIEQALIKAECALSDIAEGEAEESEGDPLEWAEKRAADALARIRPVMRQHQIQTSEWPPLPAHALPVPADD